jgi:hypothetical protein
VRSGRETMLSRVSRLWAAFKVELNVWRGCNRGFYCSKICRKKSLESLPGGGVPDNRGPTVIKLAIHINDKCSLVRSFAMPSDSYHLEFLYQRYSLRVLAVTTSLLQQQNKQVIHSEKDGPKIPIGEFEGQQPLFDWTSVCAPRRRTIYAVVPCQEEPIPAVQPKQ